MVMTFADHVNDIMVKNFLAYMEIEKGSSKNTIRGYAHDLYTLITWLQENSYITDPNNVNWNQITIFHLRGFLAYLHNNRENKPSSIHRRVCTLKGFFKFLRSNKVIENDPAEDLSYPKRAKSLPKFLPTNDMEKLLNSKKKSQMHQTVLEVLYSTGARCNEVRNINLDDIEFNYREVINESGEVEKLLTGQIMIRGGKGSKDRLVLLTNRAARAIQAYIEGERKQVIEKTIKRHGSISEDARKALFLSNRGKRVANRTIQHFISKISEATGVRHTTPHMIRHSFASHLVMNKTNIRAIQQLLGHSSLDTTQIYANITPDYLRHEFEDSLPIK